MNFTREPIIETVITPRDGCKLIVRNSKGSGQEDYCLDAVEVVSFGHSFFFRSSERPKSFLVPVSDYEVLELKEVRMPLKNVAPERSIKIGGGREGPVRPSREISPESESPDIQAMERTSDRLPERPLDRDRKRDKRRRGRRGGGRSESSSHEMRGSSVTEEPLAASNEGAPEGNRVEDHKPPSFISKLFPPPPTLIKETLSRYKPAEVEEDEVSSSEDTLTEMIFEEPPSLESKPDSEEDATFEE